MNIKTEQFVNNINILEELTKNIADINILKQYKGFGGLRQCFYDKVLYAKLMHQIRANFGIENQSKVFETLKHSTKSAYYTPKEIITFIYRYLIEVCNFEGGEILEPACGHGAFFEYMPEHIRKNSKILGVEYDILTSKLVKKIYSDAHIINDGLQNINFKEKRFDLIIGNPPYSDEVIIDKDLLYKDISGYTIHHYFVAKCVRLLKDNGLLVFILPAFFMDNKHGSSRHIVNNESVVIDVIRLPENLFNHATITVDILILRKTGNKLHDISEVVEIRDNEAKCTSNSYWINNFKRVLGKMTFKWINAYNRYVLTCVAEDKTKVLQYLTICRFDDSTIANFQKVIINSTQKELLNILDDIRSLNLQIKQMNNDIEVLKNKVKKLAFII